MRITQSDVNIIGKTTQNKVFSQKQTLLSQNRGQALGDEQKQLLKELKKQAKMENQGTVTATGDFEYALTEKDLQEVRLLERILSQLLGREVKFNLPKINLSKLGEAEAARGLHGGQSPNAQNGGQAPQVGGQALVFERETYYREESSYKMSTHGKVITADGREIEFSLNAKMSSHFEFYEKINVDITGKVVDPLVIQYEGNLPGLSAAKYEFDIDNDGQSDQISYLSKGSGFLALDKNGDGTINNGRELFGTITGNGFAELAYYDEDNNGWIDENDSVFDKLRIWMKHEDGTDQLIALGEKGIGAIFLGSVKTPYELKTSVNQRNGIVQQSGIYLKENGQAGHIQHIDLQL